MILRAPLASRVRRGLISSVSSRSWRPRGIWRSARRPIATRTGLPPVAVLQVLRGHDGSGRPDVLPPAGVAWRGRGAAHSVQPRQSDPAWGRRPDPCAVDSRWSDPENHSHHYTARSDPADRDQPASGSLEYFARPRTAGVSSDRQGVGQGMDGVYRRDHECAAMANWWKRSRPGPRARMGLPKARVVARLGDPTAPKAVSLIAIHQHGIPDAFPDAAVSRGRQCKARRAERARGFAARSIYHRPARCPGPG